MSRTPDFSGVNETAFLTAIARALESERPDALFRDPDARALAGSLGEKLVRRVNTTDGTVAATAVRTFLLDEMLIQTIEANAIDTVLNLGAGFDTRPYRLSFSNPVRWVEVDQAAVLEYKAARLADREPLCELESIAADVTDDQAMAEILAHVCNSGRRVAVMAEGLLVYLTSDQVTTLATRLAARPEIGWWLCDLIAPAVMVPSQATVAAIFEGTDLTYRFAPEAGPGFFQPFGWTVGERRSCLGEAHRLKRWNPNAAFFFALFLERIPGDWMNFHSVFTLVRTAEAKS